MTTDAKLPERIVDRCPSCGARSLFVGTGGYLTCSVIGCNEPGVGLAIDDLRASYEQAVNRAEQWAAVARAYLMADAAPRRLHEAALFADTGRGLEHGYHAPQRERVRQTGKAEMDAP